MTERTARELGGEIWSEFNSRILKGEEPFANWNVETLTATVDLITRILARHDGEIIRNDKDLPVEPLGHPSST